MNYHYEDRPWVIPAIEHAMRGAFDSVISLRRSTRDEDLGGVDAHYVVNQQTKLQIRVRFNQLHGAWHNDVTIRTTEPSMIDAGTYAPLMFVFWCYDKDQRVHAAWLLDIYQMAQHISFTERPIVENRDGQTAFYPVKISELTDAKALLKFYDGTHWARFHPDSRRQLARILNGRVHA